MFRLWSSILRSFGMIVREVGFSAVFAGLSSASKIGKAVVWTRYCQISGFADNAAVSSAAIRCRWFHFPRFLARVLISLSSVPCTGRMLTSIVLPGCSRTFSRKKHGARELRGKGGNVYHTRDLEGKELLGGQRAAWTTKSCLEGKALLVANSEKRKLIVKKTVIAGGSNQKGTPGMTCRL